MPNDRDEEGYEYGFADSHMPNHIWWYTFGGMVNFATLEQARHTASKSVSGEAIFYRRKGADSVGELVPEDAL